MRYSKCSKCYGKKYPNYGIRFDWYCGKKSGIPWHCRIFFIIFWRKFVRLVYKDGKINTNSILGSIYLFLFEKGSRNNFIICPVCMILGSKKKVKYCEQYIDIEFKLE